MIEVHIRHGQASGEVGWGLTDEGKEQSILAGRYVRANFVHEFPVCINSGSRRAVQTAELLGFSGAVWQQDSRLRESDWEGAPEPRDFLAWGDAFGRVGEFCSELDRAHPGQNRIIVSHGGTMKMVRAVREGYGGKRFHLLFESPYKYFTNCQVLVYSDGPFVEGDLSGGGLWVKSVCPWSEKPFGHDWLKVL